MIVAAALLAYAALYGRRALRLARRGRPVPAWRIASFVAGLLVLALALSGPVDKLADRRLSWHMAEHLLIADVASVLVVFGLTGPLLAPLLRAPLVGRLRALAHPVPALVLWATDFWLWHVPALYDATLRHDGVHALEHGCFFVFGALLWMPLFGPFPRPAWFGAGAQLTYVLIVRVAAGVLANLFIWSGTAFYAAYPRVGDQSAAGAIMMVEDSVVLVTLFAWLFLRWMRDAGERQELSELAARLRRPVDEPRIARAVAAGRGGELRRRLEGPRA
ncbi:MAG TPA: cytochrome c oxidase assembly protein [Solirubrobacteraceae bacterium]|jgi:cytochrome c oxidase assembly factor CtaG|nr:cytochrome c oxidase assembly protein [Solirubrobacteraceae bacterium]